MALSWRLWQAYGSEHRLRNEGSLVEKGCAFSYMSCLPITIEPRQGDQLPQQLLLHLMVSSGRFNRERLTMTRELHRLFAIDASLLSRQHRETATRLNSLTHELAASLMEAERAQPGRP